MPLAVAETWKVGRPMLKKRGDFVVTVDEGKVIVAGGLGESSLAN